MDSAKFIPIDIKVRGPVTKEAVLKRLKQELDKEFKTDLIDHSRITITLNRENIEPPQHKPKK